LIFMLVHQAYHNNPPSPVMYKNHRTTVDKKTLHKPSNN